MPYSTTLCEVVGATKTFPGGVKALDEVSLAQRTCGVLAPAGATLLVSAAAVLASQLLGSLLPTSDVPGPRRTGSTLACLSGEW